MKRREVVAGLCAGLIVGCASRQAAEEPTRRAPDFSRVDSEGSNIRLEDYRGKVVLVDFWATWCGGCKVEIPWFIQFVDAFRDRGFAVIGVALDEEGWAAVRPFIAELGVNYPVVLGDEEMIAGYDVTVLPKTLLIDRGGNIVFSHVGLADRSELETQIETLIGSG